MVEAQEVGGLTAALPLRLGFRLAARLRACVQLLVRWSAALGQHQYQQVLVVILMGPPASPGVFTTCCISVGQELLDSISRISEDRSRCCRDGTLSSQLARSAKRSRPDLARRQRPREPRVCVMFEGGCQPPGAAVNKK